MERKLVNRTVAIPLKAEEYENLNKLCKVLHVKIGLLMKGYLKTALEDIEKGRCKPNFVKVSYKGNTIYKNVHLTPPERDIIKGLAKKYDMPMTLICRVLVLTTFEKMKKAGVNI